MAPLTRSLSALVLASVLAIPGTARADTVVLKNGRRFTGCKIIIDNPDTIEFEIPGGTKMRFPRSRVASVEKDSQPGTKAAAADDIAIPDGALDEEVEKLRSLITTLRETRRRLDDARKDKADAEKAGADGADRAKLAQERIQELESEVARLKRSKEPIEKAAAERFEKQKADARQEAVDLRNETDKLYLKDDVPGLAERAVELLARVPKNPRDPRCKEIRSEAVHAMDAAARIDMNRGRDAKTPEDKIRLLTRAGEHFAWCAKNAQGSERAAAWQGTLDAYAEAHRATGTSARAPAAVEIERALVGIEGYSLCASLVEERLDERRWGPEVTDSESMTFKLELKDGRPPVYQNDPPTSMFEQSAWERRERAEQRTSREGAHIVKVVRWYALVWDAQKRRWVRDSGATQVEAQKVVPLLRTAQEKNDTAMKTKADRDAAERVLAEKHAATLLARQKRDEGEGKIEDVESAASLERSAERDLAAADEKANAARTALQQAQHELFEAQSEADRAAKGLN